MKTRDITTVAVIAALYAALTILVSPIAYGMLQFRVSELLKPLALKGRLYILALTLGLFLANLFSPFLGTLELLLMPLACLVGGEITYRLRKWPVLALTIYSAVITGAVAAMLHVVAGLPFWVTAGFVFIPEFILIQTGRGLVDCVLRRTQAVGIGDS